MKSFQLISSYLCNTSSQQFIDTQTVLNNTIQANKLLTHNLWHLNGIKQHFSYQTFIYGTLVLSKKINRVW